MKGGEYCSEDACNAEVTTILNVGYIHYLFPGTNNYRLVLSYSNKKLLK